MNTPVSFELAKLLKEKGFLDKNIYGEVRLSQPKFYDNDGIIHNIKDAFEKTELNLRKCYNAPTISVVVMWLYEKHGIWISVIDVTPLHVLWEYQISKKDVGLIHSSGQYPAQYDYSPTEAYEKGIEYTLNNLI